MNATSAIEFGTDEKAAIVDKIKRYFAEQLGQDIGQFDAEFLLDFFAEEIGGHFYNRGLHDARAVLAAKLDDIDDALFAIERPT